MNVYALCEWLLLICAFYFATLNLVYLYLCIRSTRELRLFSPTRIERFIPNRFSELMPLVSVLVPAHNEEKTIHSTLRSLLQLSYPSFEVICINDGSLDGTLSVLQRDFDLERVQRSPHNQMKHNPIRAIYRSRRYPNLMVIDKEKGGKADALNAGIAFANYDYTACIDSDTILERDSLMGLVRPFLDDPNTVAVGGTVALANGCVVREGNLIKKGIPKSLLAKFQSLEYLRAFLFGRVGWSALDALLNISGAFGLFKTQTLIDVGGYKTDTVTEDMDLTLRIHAFYRLRGLPYRVHFITDPICWTEAPETFSTLKKQRVRWHRGLAESLYRNRELFLNPKAGFLGMVVVPFQVIFELLQPIMQLLGTALIVFCVAFSIIRPDYLLLLTVMMFFASLLLSAFCVMLEEAFFHSRTFLKDILWLFACALFENFGYRQLVAWYEIVGIFKWLTTSKEGWGQMDRSGSWATRK